MFIFLIQHTSNTELRKYLAGFKKFSSTQKLCVSCLHSALHLSKAVSSQQSGRIRKRYICIQQLVPGRLHPGIFQAWSHPALVDWHVHQQQTRHCEHIRGRAKPTQGYLSADVLNIYAPWLCSQD